MLILGTFCVGNIFYTIGGNNVSKVNFSVIEGVSYIGDKNDNLISKNNSHINTIFNLESAQASYYTLLIEGFEYSRYYTSHMSTTASPRMGRRDGYYSYSSDAFNYTGMTPDYKKEWHSTGFENFKRNGSIYWIPVKSLTYTQGAIENTTFGVGAFADLQLPFRKHSPTLQIEMYDARSDFFEMKLREWHNMSVITDGFVPVLESISKKVQIRSWATNGECNSLTECQCILADDISVTRSYEANDLKIISFKLVVVGWGGGK